MSLGQELAPHLPFLRRYARALTGSQAHGDAFVRATLRGDRRASPMNSRATSIRGSVSTRLSTRSGRRRTSRKAKASRSPSGRKASPRPGSRGSRALAPGAAPHVLEGFVGLQAI